MPNELEVIRAALKSAPGAYLKLRKMAEEGKLGTFKEVNPDEPLTIVAAPDHFGIQGAKRVLCGCGIAIWLSPSTQEMIKARGAAPTTAPTTVICAMCFGKTLKDRREEERTQ